MKPSKNIGFVFIAVSLPFFALGMSTKRIFLIIAVSLLVLGLALTAQSRWSQ